jgi:hypothetical protein
MPHVLGDDFARCIERFAGARPFGEDVERDPIYQDLRAEVQKIGVDWTRVRTWSIEILSSRSKDLTVASYLTLALFHLDGYAGMMDGLEILHKYLKDDWKGIFPPVARPRDRALALESLAAWLALLVKERPPRPAEAVLLRPLLERLQAFEKMVRLRLKHAAPSFSALQSALSGHLPVSFEETAPLEGYVAVPDDEPYPYPCTPAPGGADPESGFSSREAPASFGVQPEAALREADEVRISAWHPRALPVGETAKLLVYAHLQAARDAVARDAGQVLGKAAAGHRTAEASTAARIAAGTEILIVPQGEGLRFDPPQARITWSGAWQRADFTMTATGDRVGHVIEGSIACYVGPLLVADVRLPVVVPRPGAPAEDPAEPGPALQSARLYQSIFASYSHDDTPLVEAMEKAYKALGMDYLRDVMTLKSGQSWSDELLQMIEQADIFQLFWSTRSSQSPYVEQEWRHALGLAGRKGAAFIRPIYWEKPLPKVPEPLSRIHFAPFDVPGLAPAPFLLGEDGETGLRTLTVSTWAAADPADPAGGRLKARTRIALNGDVDSYLSPDPADAHLLDVHATLVAEALRARRNG